MPETSLPAVAAAVRAAWSRDTCDDDDLPDWTPDDPAGGQCGASALVVHDLLGGELLLAEVLRADGSRQGVHWWNRLPGGEVVDLTREQFRSGELVQEPRVVERPSGPPRRCAAQYVRLRDRAHRALGLDSGDPPLPHRPAVATDEGHRPGRRRPGCGPPPLPPVSTPDPATTTAARRRPGSVAAR